MSEHNHHGYGHDEPEASFKVDIFPLRYCGVAPDLDLTGRPFAGRDWALPRPARSPFSQ
jgi:hypothetical protein